MRLIIGLGNPGCSYSKTRHNVGRKLIEHIASEEKLSFSKKKALKISYTSTTWDNKDIVLAYPETYMNLSGQAVSSIVSYFKIDFSKDVLVIVDDIALPFGKLRLRAKGSSGGHKGLISIEEYLGGKSYPRLRVGIDAPLNQPLEKYVLSNFNKLEKSQINDFLDMGNKACYLWATQPLTRAMNKINSHLR